MNRAISGRRFERIRIGVSLAALTMFVILAFTHARSLGAQSGTLQRILYGEVISAEQGIVVDQPTGRGAQTGATVGAVAGYALADRGDRWIGSLLGGALGGAAGHAAEKSAKKKPGWELIIRLDSGEEIGVQVPVKKKDRNKVLYRPGDRVRMMTGPNGKTQVTPVAK
jgi:outer membrane lipoprotein SlyB